jgi:hypothetical protein
MMNPRVEQTIDAIHDACASIDTAWRKAGRDIQAFPDIAMECTEGLDLSVFGNIGNLTAVLSLPKIAELQAPASFSDLYYVLFRNPHFYVEVLNWWGSDINVHDHDFSGVQIQVLDSSLNVEYAFDEQQCVDGVATGTTTISKAELWPQGGRSRVVPGMPHNVSHLAEPTVSILFRTHPNPNFGPQRNYFAPNIAATYPVHSVTWRKNTKMLRLLATARDKSRFAEAFHTLTASQSANENLFTLIKMVDLIFAPDVVHLVHELSTKDELSGQIAGAAAFYRANEILAKSLKYSCATTADEMICASALSAAFDFPSFKRINDDLVASGYDIDLWSTLDKMVARAEGRDAVSLERLVSMFGLETRPLAA